MRYRDAPRWLTVLTAAAVSAGALGLGCGGVQYVEGPDTLGPYTGPGAGGPQAVYEGRLDAKDAVVERGSFADHYSLFGERGERLVVSLVSDQFDSYLLVVDGSGRILAEDDDSLGNLGARLEVELPADAIYLIVATSYSRDTGHYELRVVRGGGVTGYPYVSLPVDIQRRFTVPGPEDPSGNPFHVYAFDVRGGSEISADLLSGQADAFLRLYDALGREVASDDDSGGHLNAHLVYTPPDPGRYYLVATTYAPPEPWGGAAYRLTVTQ